MSDFISKIEYILDPKEFADKVNESTNKIFCLLFYESPKLTATDNNLTERLVLEKFDNFDVSAIYSDVILVDNDLHSPQLYPSYFPNLLNSGLIIQSPIFVCSKPGLTLTYNSNLKVLYGYYNVIIGTCIILL